MNWGSVFGRGPAQAVDSQLIPGITPLQQQRLKQIESLHSFNQNVVEEEWDKEYSIQFTAGGQLFKLCIKLPSQFPHEKPSVQLMPGGIHPWLDEKMYVIGCSLLNKFYMHSNLGKVIRSLIEDFKANPPQNSPVSSSFVESTLKKYNEVTPSTPTAILISTASVEEESNTKAAKDPEACTTITELVDSLKELSIGIPYSGTTLIPITPDTPERLEELEELSDDSAELFKYVRNMDSIKDLQEKRKELIEKNRDQAERNLSDRPKIHELQASIKGKYKELQGLESRLLANIAKQEELFQMFDLNQIVTNLRIAISQAEEASEEIAESFLEKKMPVDEFLRKYLETRKLSHLRKSKEERIRCLNPQY